MRPIPMPDLATRRNMSMTSARNRNRYFSLAVAVLAAAGLAAACSSTSSSPAAKGGGVNSAGTPVSGGTLKIIAASGPDHIDPVSAYYTADYELLRAYTRQLLSYPSVDYSSTSDPGWTKTVTPTADMATEVPTQANGGISADGKTYTFHIKPGIDWDSTPVRAVTSQDFLREFKAFCNPAPGGFVGNPSYYLSTISGLNDYCNAEQAYFAN